MAQASEPERLLAIELRAANLKHTTTLCLTAAGGVVTLAGSIFQGGEDFFGLWLAAGFLSPGACFSFTAGSSLLKSLRSRQKLDRSIRLGELFGSIFLGMGVGAFLYVATDNLGTVG